MGLGRMKPVGHKCIAVMTLVLRCQQLRGRRRAAVRLQYRAASAGSGAGAGAAAFQVRALLGLLISLDDQRICRHLRFVSPSFSSFQS